MSTTQNDLFARKSRITYRAEWGTDYWINGWTSNSWQLISQRARHNVVACKILFICWVICAFLRRQREFYIDSTFCSVNTTWRVIQFYLHFIDEPFILTASTQRWEKSSRNRCNDGTFNFRCGIFACERRCDLNRSLMIFAIETMIVVCFYIVTLNCLMAKYWLSTNRIRSAEIRKNKHKQRIRACVTEREIDRKNLVQLIFWII